MRRHHVFFIRLLVGGLTSLILGIGSLPSLQQSVRAEAFNSSRLIDDATFIATDAMSISQIQQFLDEAGSGLRNFSENGRSAAQIIWDASHGHGAASNNGGAPINGILVNGSTGTVNPQVLLVTLQKEQSLISLTNPSQSSLDHAMGYGCPDSGGCNSTYLGFTKQVENAAWQLRYNYERAQGTGFGDYQVGQAFCFNDWNGTHCGTYENRATSSLYRYTPHVYNGNYNFWNLYFNVYQFSVPDYAAHAISWSSSDGLYRYPSVLAGNNGSQLSITLKNTGKRTWHRGVVNLGTSGARDRVSSFLRESGTGAPSGWLSPNRIAMQETSVAPGQAGTFTFWLQAPSGMSPRTSREHFELVADGVGWFGPNIYWDLKVLSTVESYRSGFVSQNGYPTLRAGESYQFSVSLENTGKTTWQKGVVNLGTDRDRDRVPGFTREGAGPSGWIAPNRIALQQTSVAPGQVGTFTFWYTVPAGKAPGTYREYFRPVADGVTWMEDWGIYWDVTVIQ